MESYQFPSPPLSNTRLVNFYAEQEPDNSRTDVALIATPGLDPFGFGVVFGAGPVAAINADRPGVIYAYSGTHFYRATLPFGSGTFTVEDLGDVGAPSVSNYSQNVMVTIASGITGAVIVVPPNAFTCTHAGALNQMGGTFPGANSVTYLDGYYVFTSDDLDAQFFCCRLLDPTNFDALDFAFTDAVPNVIQRVMTLRGELWFLGDAGVEIWYDAGLPDFPFRRQSGGFIPFNVDSIKTCTVLDNSMWWVSQGGTVFRSVGYQARRVSTHAIEEVIRGIGTTNAICGFSYVQDGHSFYCVTYGNVTLVYDVATQKWHERSTQGGDWLPLCSTRFGVVPLFGSSGNGTILTTVPPSFTDNGVVQSRIIQLPPLWGGTSRAFCGRVEVELELGAGSNPGSVVLQWSDDGGYNWTSGRTLQADNSGHFRKRVYTTRLGSFRQRQFRLSMTGHTVVYAVDAALVGGVN